MEIDCLNRSTGRQGLEGLKYEFRYSPDLVEENRFVVKGLHITQTEKNYWMENETASKYADDCEQQT